MPKQNFRNASGFIPLLGLVIILAVAIIAAGSIYYVARQEKTTNTNTAVTVNTSNVNANRNTNVNANQNANTTGLYCGGIAGRVCPAGYRCEMDENINISDATGVCVVSTVNANGNANTNVAVNSNANRNVNSHSNTNSTNVNTTNWLTYHSTRYGLTFQYPDTWTVEEGELNSPYSVYAHGTGGSIRFWLDRPYDGQIYPNGVQTTSSDVTIAGRTARRSDTRLSDGTLYFVIEKFTVQPTGWGTDAAISISPSAAGTMSTQDAIIATLTIN